MKAGPLLVFVLLTTWCAHAVADDEAANWPVVRSSEYGRKYAKSVPSEDYGQKGTTRVFSVGKGRDTPICEYDWYANEIYLGGAGDGTLVRFGPWHRGSKPQENQLALGIYRDGRMVREYSTLELQKLGSGVSESVSHYTVFERRRGFRWLTADEYVFEVEGVDGRLLRFDLRTGAILEDSTEPGSPPDLGKH